MKIYSTKESGFLKILGQVLENLDVLEGIIKLYVQNDFEPENKNRKNTILSVQ